jgi:hypothetical protein
MQDDCGKASMPYYQRHRFGEVAAGHSSVPAIERLRDGADDSGRGSPARTLRQGTSMFISLSHGRPEPGKDMHLNH